MFLLRLLLVVHVWLLGGSGDLGSKVISTLIGAISNCKYSYLNCNPTVVSESHDPLSRVSEQQQASALGRRFHVHSSHADFVGSRS